MDGDLTASAAEPGPVGLTVVLPFPDRSLSPNGGGNWPAKSRAAKTARRAGYFAAMAVLARAHPWRSSPPSGPISYQLIFVPKVARNRDHDNLVASMKHFLDGVADALGVNDSRFVLRGMSVLRPDRMRPRVELVLEAVPA